MNKLKKVISKSHKIAQAHLYCITAVSKRNATCADASLLKFLLAKGVESERFCISLFKNKRLIDTFLI